EARQLVGPGGIGARGPVLTVFGSTHRGQGLSHRRSRRLAAAPKQTPRQGELAVHKRESADKTQAALPVTLIDSGDYPYVTCYGARKMFANEHKNLPATR